MRMKKIINEGILSPRYMGEDDQKLHVVAKEVREQCKASV